MIPQGQRSGTQTRDLQSTHRQFSQPLSREGHEGPVFIQGDHFQINAKYYEKDKDAEINKVKGLIKEAVEACFLISILIFQPSLI